MSESQPIRFGRYLLLEKIAAGGMAQLYRGKILGVQGFEKLIAVKTILPHLVSEKDLVSSFIDEAKLAALLSHQNIVQIYDFGSMENSYFIAMEYLFGKDLRAVLRQIKAKNLPLSLEYTLYIISRVCSGLDYAHKLKDFQGKPLNLIHRDISPQNIFLTYEGEIKILDFGIAKAATQSTVTQFGMIKGKVAYMSPEQASGDSSDHRSDIFSTGIILYEMVTGRPMFTGDTLQILAKVQNAQFEPPESLVGNLPPKLYEIFQRSLAKDPQERYQSCGQMLTDLEECLFALGFHPTADGLSHYMKMLFEEEIAAEGRAVEESASAIPQEAPEGEKEKETGEKSQEQVAAGEEAPPRAGKRGILYGMAAVAILAVVAVLALWPKAEKAPGTAKESLQPPAADLSSKAPPAKAPAAEAAKAKEQRTEAQVQARTLQEQAAGLMEKKPDEARDLLLKAVQLDPQNAPLHSQLGLAYMKTKNYPQAIGAYRRVTELEPQFADAYFNLGYLYAMNKNYPVAEDMYDRTVKLAPPYLDEALFNLSIVQEKQGKKKESVENLEKALKINPQNETAKKLLNRLKKAS